MTTITFTVPGVPVAKGRARKATDAQILAAYAESASCKKVAALLGMCHQSVHERLVRLGVNKPVRIFTDAEVEMLRSDYDRHASAGTLDALAAQMQRTKAFICRQARVLGMTSQTRSRPYLDWQVLSDRAKAHIAEHGHPKGMAGKRHPESAKKRMSEASKARWSAMTGDERAAYTLRMMKAKDAAGGLVGNRPHGTWKAGWREIGSQRAYFRSRWEANFGRYLEWLRASGGIQQWEHEPETFWFEKIKLGARSYLPDFRVTETDGRIVYYEVKGWMDARSKTKINRMRIYHPKVRLIVIDSKQYAALARKVAALIQGWEA